MPRRGQIAKRDVLPDPLYNSKLVTRLINNIMYDGKKGVAQKIVYGAFDIVKEKTGKEPIEVFEEAMENVMPQLEVKARRAGGATYQVPMEVRPERRQTLGLRWITTYSRTRSEKDHEGASCRRNSRCFKRHRRSSQKARRHSQDGRSQQGFCTLPLVVSFQAVLLDNCIFILLEVEQEENYAKTSIT